MARIRLERWSKRWGLLLLALSALALASCQHEARRSNRRGEEIVVAGVLVRTGTRVVLWSDPGGYDGYQLPPPPPTTATSPRQTTTAPAGRNFGLRGDTLSPEQLRDVRERGWNLRLLRETIDQLVFHYDSTGTSRACFRVLHHRGLSCHFLIDLDGTIYQTLDLQERAWHATTSNNRSIGIEIANVGALPRGKAEGLARWYRHGPGGTRVVLPAEIGDGGIRTPGFVARPARDAPIVGRVQGQELVQYDFTAEQYRALTHLTATLCRVFPNLACDYPRDAAGKPIPHKLPDERLARYQGLLGHYHIQTNKVDPGPAFQWDLVVDNARRMMR